jgi:hypothetical protein
MAATAPSTAVMCNMPVDDLGRRFVGHQRIPFFLTSIEK